MSVRLAALGAGLLAAHAALNAALLRTPPARAQVTERVSVLVPARNEAERIGACVRALLDQRGVVAEVLVLDDDSTDGTAALARALGARVLPGQCLPAGWLGKPHACQQLADSAGGDVLAFVDADVVLAPDGLARSVALLRTAGLDLVSPYPRQVAVTVAERLVQPLLQWSWLTFLPLRLAERLPSPSLVAANGQLLVCDATAYRAVGGHAAVRAEVVEDLALARAFKRAGRRATVADGTDIATCRMYGGWDDVRDGYGKSLWAAFGSPAGAAAAVALLGWLYVLPALAAARGSRVGALGYAAGVAGRAISAARTGGRPLDALAHPLSVCALGYLTALSSSRKATGRLSWRGRAL